MPTKRTRGTRGLIGGQAEIEAAAEYFRFGYLLGGADTWGSDKTKAEILDFYRKHKAEILAANSRQCQSHKEPFRRPYPFWDELEAEHPRKKTGTERWWGPWTKSGPPKTETVSPVFENDQQYLARLGLLEDWEKEIN